MASTLLEQARATHEDNERLERLVVKDLQQEVRGHKERLHQSHRVRKCADAIKTNSARLVEIYEDADGARKDEIAALGGTAPDTRNVFGAFYDRLKEIREYHRRHPGAKVLDAAEDEGELLRQEPSVEFSGEESLGRHMDLHELHRTWCNAKFGAPCEYTAYLDDFARTGRVPRHHKLTRAYRAYVAALVRYLESFLDRAEPLKELSRVYERADADFAAAWEAGAVEGWEDRGAGGARVAAAAAAQQSFVDLQEFDTIEELMDADLVKPEQIKQALQALGLKAGGTPLERAQRLLLTKDTDLADIDPKHFSRGVLPPRRAAAAADNDRLLAAAREVAREEARLQALVALLPEVIAETKAHVEKKQGMNPEELEEEQNDVEAGVEEESDDEDAAIYNPLKLPMGWDGKPIPYWLYKLHGLNQEFKCEICGDTSYRGRRAFERHFKEWKHQHGMKALGIPSIKAFNEITSIEEAKELWSRMREKQGLVKWRPEEEEEFEDAQGNVMNKADYTLIKLQGIL